METSMPPLTRKERLKRSFNLGCQGKFFQWKKKTPQIQTTDPHMDVSKNRGTPKWMVYNGKPNQNRWFGGTLIFGNTHISGVMGPLLKSLVVGAPCTTIHHQQPRPQGTRRSSKMEVRSCKGGTLGDVWCLMFCSHSGDGMFRPSILRFWEGSGFLGLHTLQSLHHLKGPVFLCQKKSFRTLSPFVWMMTRLDSSSSHNQLHNQPQLTKQWHLPRKLPNDYLPPQQNQQKHATTPSPATPQHSFKRGARLPVINRLVSSNPSCSYKFVFGPFILLMAQISGDHQSIWYYMFHSFQGFLSYIPGGWPLDFRTINGRGFSLGQWTLK